MLLAFRVKQIKIVKHDRLTSGKLLSNDWQRLASPVPSYILGVQFQLGTGEANRCQSFERNSPDVNRSCSTVFICLNLRASYLKRILPIVWQHVVLKSVTERPITFVRTILESFVDFVRSLVEYFALLPLSTMFSRRFEYLCTVIFEK